MTWVTPWTISKACVSTCLVGGGRCWTTWLPRNCVQILHLDTRHRLVLAPARPAPAVKPGHGAGRPRKQVELLKRENRSLKQVVCGLRGLVRRLRAELQAKIDEIRPKTSLKTPKRERAARRATERGVVSLAGGYKCVLLRTVGHAGADAVVAHLDTGIARQTVCRWEQLLGASVLAPCPRLL